MSTEQEQAAPTTGKKQFSPEVKKEAVRLLVEEKLPLDQVAAKIGCCINSLQNWKAKVQQPQKSGSRKQTSRAKGKKHFSAKAKKEAMRLLREEKLSYQQIADQIGCSVTTIKNWKAALPRFKKSSLNPTPTPMDSRRQPNDDKPTTKREPQVTYDDFVRGYWNGGGGKRAVDVLLLPPEIGPEIVRYVNEALRYGYDQFSK
ncbi:MAG: transposase [Planctomycetaceae bacterium]|nr:transposase [Planctomycetaceae bacterium]